MIKNIFLLTTLGLVTTTLASLSGADGDSAINPRDTFDIMDGHDAVSRITNEILHDGFGGAISAINKADDDDATDDLQDLLIGFSTDIENVYLAGVIINSEEAGYDVQEIVLRAKYDTDIGDFMGELARADIDINDTSITSAKIALDTDYNDLSVDGILLYQLKTDTDGDDDEEYLTGDLLVEYPITDGLSATGNIRMVDAEDLGSDSQVDSTMILVGVNGRMTVGDDVTLVARANVGSNDITETDAADDEENNEEDIIQWSLSGEYETEKMALEVNFGQIMSDNENEKVHLEFNAEGSYYINDDIVVLVYAQINQELEDDDVVDTKTSIGGSVDYFVNDDFVVTGVAHFYDYDDEDDDSKDKESTQLGASISYLF